MVSAELPISNLVVLMESHMLYVMKNQLKKGPNCKGSLLNPFLSLTAHKLS